MLTGDNEKTANYIAKQVGIDEVIDKIQVKLSFYKAAYQHVYFALQRLYLLPQGRAPPLAL